MKFIRVQQLYVYTLCAQFLLDRSGKCEGDAALIQISRVKSPKTEEKLSSRILNNGSLRGSNEAKQTHLK